jgi:hypothetical protein
MAEANRVDVKALAALLGTKLRVSSHLESWGGVINIVGNNSGKRRVATGDEIQLHLVAMELQQALEDVLGDHKLVGEMVARANARQLLAQLKEKD